jgi:hypothetical protein
MLLPSGDRGHLTGSGEIGNNRHMRYKTIALALVLTAAFAQAKEPKAYQSGKLLQMDTVQCGAPEKGPANRRSETTCQEYVLQTEQVSYRIRPKDSTHAVLLPASDRAQFRLDKNKFLLRIEDLDSKEREFIVVSMTPRGESSADANPVKLNHLQ